MFVPYDTVRNRVNWDYPGRSYTFLGTGHCGNAGPKLIGHYYANCPALEIKYFEPFVENIQDDRTHQKGKTGGIPPYRYTSRNVSKQTIEQFLVERPDGNGDTIIYEQDGLNREVDPFSCLIDVTAVRALPFNCRWTQVDNVNDFAWTTYNKHTWNQTKINNALTSVQNDVALQALTSYDLLTEVAEAREIPALLASLGKDIFNIYRQFRRGHALSDLRRTAHISPHNLRRSAQRAFRKIGDEWMQYRYGIMPLVYSASSLAKIAKMGQEKRHHRKQIVTPDPTGVTLPGSSSWYKWTEITGDITFRANVFQYFEHGLTAQMASIGFNPLVTAWELIPYSFVADWFINIGDYIARATSQSTTRVQWACVSRRESHTVSTYAHYKNDSRTINPSVVVQSGWYGQNPPAATPVVITRPEASYLIKKVVTNSYQRWTFGINDARVVINPNLNWRRMIDGSVMTFNQLGKLIAYLRKK